MVLNEAESRGLARVASDERILSGPGCPGKPPPATMAVLSFNKAGGTGRRLFSTRTTWLDRLGQQLGNVSQDGLGLRDDLLHHIVDFRHVLDALRHFPGSHHRLFLVALEDSFD